MNALSPRPRTLRDIAVARCRRAAMKSRPGVEPLEARGLPSVMLGPMPGMSPPARSDPASAMGSGSMPGMGAGTMTPGGPKGYLAQHPELRFRRGANFANPPELDSRGGVLQATLVADDRTAMIGGRPILARVYDGSFPGPTLRVRPGDRLEITLVNRLAEPTNLHLHGLHVSPGGNQDNPFLSIAPGQSFTYDVTIPADQAPGTYWYHSHAGEFSTGQVFGGLAGSIVVEGLRSELPPALRGIKQQILDLQDAQVAGGAILPRNDDGAPTTRTVNGLVQPVMRIRPGETQLWSITDMSPQLYYRLNLAGQSFTVIAKDGQPVARTYAARELVLAPGERYDVLVQGGRRGRTALRTLPIQPGMETAGYPGRTLATLVTAGQPTPRAALPTTIAPFHDLRDDPVAASREFVLTEDMMANQFFINGRMFDPNRVDVTARLGTVEEWTIRNDTMMDHPMHLHTDPVQVVAIDGRPYDAPGLEDTVNVPAGGSVTVRVAFADFTGRTVFHCHILPHEDNGMMAVVKIV